MSDGPSSDAPATAPPKRSAKSPPPTPPSPGGSESGSKLSRKREREVSVEPAPTATATTTDDPARDAKEIRVPKKKNRRDLESTVEEDDNGSRSRSTSPGPLTGSPPQEMKIKVRQISQGVEDLSWRNMNKSESTLMPVDHSDDKPDRQLSDAPSTSENDHPDVVINGVRDSDSDSGERDKGLKRKYLERGASQGPPDTVEAVKRPRDDTDKDDNPRETKRPSPPPDSPAKPAQKLGGFMAYASTKSPFSAVKGPNLFASASVKPSSPPIAGSSQLADPVFSVSPTPAKKSGFSAFATAGSPFKVNRSKSPHRKNTPATKNAFSAYKGQGVSAFAVPLTPKSARDGSPVPSYTPDSGEEDAASFGDKLRAGKDGSDDEDDNKVNLTEQDVITGEEDEDTMFSVRGKLYVLSDGQAWKERGVGVLKVNVHRTTNRARILMRKEAVHTTLLNVSLFHGMSCDLAQDPRYLRFSVLEKGEQTHMTHFNLRMGNAQVAQDLLHNIRDRIPDA